MLDCGYLFLGKFDRYIYWCIYIYIDILCFVENYVRLL